MLNLFQYGVINNHLRHAEFSSASISRSLSSITSAQLTLNQVQGDVVVLKFKLNDIRNDYIETAVILNLFQDRPCKNKKPCQLTPSA